MQNLNLNMSKTMKLRMLVAFLATLSVAACTGVDNDTSLEADSGQIGDSTYFFVFLNTNPDRPTISPDSASVLQALHMENIGKLYNEGKLDLAGPFNGGGGVFVLKAPDTTAAWGYLRGDAAVVAGRFNIELLPFEVSAGGLCKIPADNEMVQYGFLRFREKISGGVSDNPDQRVELYESGELLFSGWFDNSDAGIMVIRTTSDSLLQSIAAAHPGVSNGHLAAEIRQLWVGQGIFCE
jgi:uncharacterized protein YciI